jgi:elongation factor 1 alpha-like protein
LNKRALDVGSGFSNNVNARVNHSKAQYKPEKWMLPDQAEDILTQLNLVIVSQPLIQSYFQQWRDGDDV